MSDASAGSGLPAPSRRPKISPGIPANRFTGSARLGEALASGYFNGDCYADLAISAASASDMLILYGSASGLTTTNSAGFDRTAIRPDGEYGSGFSIDLAAADFNGDGFDDVAAAARDEGIGSHYNAGGVVVFPGTSAGLATAGSTWWDQDSPGVPGGVETLDYFGAAMTAGDTDGDGRAELIVGVPEESIGSKGGAGMVHVFRGTASGLVAGPAYDQDNAQIPGDAEAGDSFGAALTLADLDRDGRRDLVVGVSGETAGSADYTGAVNVLFSTPTGPSATGAAYIDQNTAGLPGANEDSDRFGAGLSRVVNAYGGEALIVSAPYERSPTPTRVP